MPATTWTRWAISARVKPSGKTTRNGFGAAIVVGGGGEPPVARQPDGEARPDAEQHEHRADPDPAPHEDAPPVDRPGRRPRLRRHHAGSPLDHSR